MKASHTERSQPDANEELDGLLAGELAGAPRGLDLLGLVASLSFVEESERAAALGAMMRPPPAARRDEPVAEGIASTRPGLVLVLVLIQLGLVVAVLALCVTS